jgi:hypothetical protein
VWDRIQELCASDPEFDTKWQHFKREKRNNKGKAFEAVRKQSEALKGRAELGQGARSEPVLNPEESYFFRTFFSIDGELPSPFNVELCLTAAGRDEEFAGHFKAVQKKVRARHGKDFEMELLEQKAKGGDAIMANFREWILSSALSSSTANNYVSCMRKEGLPLRRALGSVPTQPARSSQSRKILPHHRSERLKTDHGRLREILGVLVESVSNILFEYISKCKKGVLNLLHPVASGLTRTPWG